MYPGDVAAQFPDRPAMVEAESGRTVTYAELDDRSARLATLLRARGVRPGDTVLVLLDNDVRWGEVAWACWRTGLYLGAVNRHFGVDELVPVVEDAAPAVVVATMAITAAVRPGLIERGLLADVPWLVLDGGGSDLAEDYETALASVTRAPDLVETAGGRLLFSSGTTGRSKPFRVHPQPVHPRDLPLRSGSLMRDLGSDDSGNVLLVAGPAYHAGPLGFLQQLHQLGGTVVLMRRFDAEAALAAIERHGVTHSQWVPTMFVRLLRLPEEVRGRYDLSTHRVAVHGAAPCAPAVKQAVMDWWGPIVHEYFGASEGYGRTSIGPREWLAHPGSVGRGVGSTVHVTDEAGRPLPAGEVGVVWFAAEGADTPARGPDGAADLAGTRGWGTTGDLGRLDEDGYLYLTGRSSQLIISGGVNVYPREAEDVLIGHPAVDDVAVLGVPDEEFGEQVKAVVVATAGVRADEALAAELVDWCRARLAHYKCPRSVDFVDALPRSDAGKVRLPELRARYWDRVPG